MRIVIDLQGAQNNSSQRGIGRYSTALAQGIVRNKGNHEIFILLNSLFPKTIDAIKAKFEGLLPEENIVVFEAVGPADELPVDNHWRVKASEIIREQFINEFAPDAVVISSLIEGATDNTVTSIRMMHTDVITAAVLYDLIPFMDPEKYIGWDQAKRWYYRKTDALSRADLLLAISASAQREAIDNLHVDPERTINISSAVDTVFSKDSFPAAVRAKTLDKYKINKKFLMHSSAFDERKNFEGLIRAFGLLPKALVKDHQLVLVCKLDDAGRKKLQGVIKNAGLTEKNVILTGFVSDDELIHLYSECHLFVFPSLHEGFGLPILEAMSCGCPAIGSDNSSIPEVIGMDAALFDPTVDSSIATLIEKTLTDDSFYRELKANALLQAKSFSWDITAQRTIAGLEAVKLRNASKKAAPVSRQSAIEHIATIDTVARPTEHDLVSVAHALQVNEQTIRLLRSRNPSNQLAWRVEGPFDSSYSLALLNRETARALASHGHNVVLHSTEGPGDFAANPEFLNANPDLADMHAKVPLYPHNTVDVASRNLYPPRVGDMQAPTNLLHHYAWEESGFPKEWIDNFNGALTGVTCLSAHVEKILIDNGLAIPANTSGCGVDHWERIEADGAYKVQAKKFRFLHVSSCFPRKGADSMLDAYGKAFSKHDAVSLVIKTFQNPHNEIHTWLAAHRAKNPNYPDVVVIEGDLSDQQLKALYQQCQVLVAPSLAEGFGLPMAEAMLSGLPVITTNWGGQLDFCNSENAWLVDYEFERAKTHFEIYTSVWAKVKIDSLSDAMRKAYQATPVERARKADAGRQLLLESFKWEHATANAVESVHKWKSQVREEVKVGWISTWNTKCGIATYSKHLLEQFPANSFTVFAPRDTELTDEDEDFCIRSWNRGKDNNDFESLNNAIVQSGVNVIVLQFNYGFFDFDSLRTFMEQQKRAGKVVLVCLHSTVDPSVVTGPNWEMRTILPALTMVDRILVHSVPDLNRLKNMQLVNNVALFPHGILDTEVAAHKKPGPVPLVASYGFCLPHKGLMELVEATALLKKKGTPVRLRLVNAEYPAPESKQLVAAIKERVRELGISDLVEMHTQYLSDNESLALLNEANLVVFAYQETGESASGAVRYGLATGLPVAVTPLSIFEDISGATFKLPGTDSEHIAEGISDVLSQLSQESEYVKKVSVTATKWRAEHRYSAVGKRLFGTCTGLLRNKMKYSYTLNGSNPRFKTVIGKVVGNGIVNDGNTGNLLHGPYLALAAGKYTVTVQGKKDVTVQASHLDVAAYKAANVVGFAEIDNGAGDFVLKTSFTLPNECSDLEIRIWCNDIAHLEITSITVASC